MSNPLLKKERVDVKQTTVLPLSHKKVEYESYRYSDRKIINKANITNNNYTILNNMADIITARTSLSIEELRDLRVQDYEWLYVQLHIASNGALSPARKGCDCAKQNNQQIESGYKISLNLNEAMINNVDNRDYVMKLQIDDETIIVFENPTFGNILNAAEISVKYQASKEDVINRLLDEFNDQLNIEMGIKTSVNDPRKLDRIARKRFELLEAQEDVDENDIVVIAPYVKQIWVGDNIYTLGALNTDGSRPDDIFTIDDLSEFLETLKVSVNIESVFEDFINSIPYISLKYRGVCACGKTFTGELRGIEDFFGSYIQ